ncbi:MAG: hypothetical protein NDI94_01530 [Candidatus Woesearchaeota archaeon]|nr:hypothetical protein [Candidatus Woesearchaeota archaeon]
MADYMTITTGRLMHLANKLYAQDSIPGEIYTKELGALGKDHTMAGQTINSRKIQVAPFINGVYQYTFSYDSRRIHHSLNLLNLPGGVTGVLYTLDEANFFAPKDLVARIESIPNVPIPEPDIFTRYLFELQGASPLEEKTISIAAYAFSDMLSEKPQIILHQGMKEKSR